jgi:fumarate reductase subunit D
MMDLRGRSHPTYVAFLVHRFSGLGLALFLPLHFWALSRAIEGTARFDDFLRWAHNPWTRAGEFGLTVLLALHLFGGLRVLALEFLGWRPVQKTLVAATAAFGFAIGLLFLLHAF